MTIKYGGAWRKGPTGFEAGVTVGGEREIINVAHGDEEIWMLIGYLQQEWPQLFRKWLDAHPEIHPVLKQHLPPATITVQWAERVWKFKSRTRPGRKHTVTRMRGRYTCDCEAAMYGNICWAMKRAHEEDQHDAARAHASGSPRPSA